MCLSLKYKLTGSDAHQLRVILYQHPIEMSKVSVRPSYINSKRFSKNLLTLHGPQGDKIFNSAVNFSASHPFQVRIMIFKKYFNFFNQLILFLYEY